MSDLVTSGLDVVRRFALALDHDDFEAARAFVADECVYAMRDQVLEGPVAIIASYRKNGEWARRVFDGLDYDSRVEPADDGTFVVHYTDYLRHAGESHEHRCDQIVTLDSADRIKRIEHVDLPGESEAADAFLDRVGIKREA